MAITTNISKYYLSAAFIIILCITSCSSSYKSGSAWNLGAIYNPSKSTLHPSYKVYHTEKYRSVVFMKVYASELMFQPLGEGGTSVSNISVEYTLFETSDSAHVSDSGTFQYKLTQNDVDQFFITQIPFKAEKGKSYYLKLLMRDNYRKTFNLAFLEIEKKKGFGQQYFNITKPDGNPYFKNVIIGNSPFKLYHPTPQSNKLYISYYADSLPLPKPTYAVSPPEALLKKRDSLFVIDYAPETLIKLAYKGIYYFQFDTNSTEGLSVARFEQGFPKVTRPNELIEPLAYITTKGEYNNIKAKPNGKLAADNFWIESGSGIDRGRELIRIYYNRVYFANYYFTNTTAGWKTDRGMVYIVYGPPHNIKKTAKKETWIYSKSGMDGPITFTFNYTPDKFHLNNYRLERSESHDWHWREAVYAWTNGKIFLLD